ncbi:hypothetical protein ACE11G_01380 [Gordonia sp. PS3]|uniref:hypothetical protein n=1 Tax=Gordonia TaxID=2053 RepID=UPI000A9CE353|nr:MULTISPECIES: hypothetical protein [Gordonia]
MGSSSGSVQWHEVPIIGDLGVAFAQSDFYNSVWLPVWDGFAMGVNAILGQEILWHR